MEIAVKKNKNILKKIYLYAFISVIIVFSWYFLYDSPERLYEQHLGKIPNSINNIQTEGVSSLAGGCIAIWFEISPAELEKVIEENNFKKMPPSFLQFGERTIINSNGEKTSVNELEYLKHKAKKNGIIPYFFYIKEGSSNISTYYLLFVNAKRNRVFYLYHKY